MRHEVQGTDTKQARNDDAETQPKDSGKCSSSSDMTQIYLKREPLKCINHTTQRSSHSEETRDKPKNNLCEV